MRFQPCLLVMLSLASLGVAAQPALPASSLSEGLRSKELSVRQQAVLQLGDDARPEHLDLLLEALGNVGDQRARVDELVARGILWKGLRAREASIEARARKLTQAALERAPTLQSAPLVHLVLGLWRESESQYAEAEKLYRRGRELASAVPDTGTEEVRGVDAAIQFRLVRLLDATGQLEQAREVSRGLSGAIEASTKAVGLVDTLHFESPVKPLSRRALQIEQRLADRRLALSGRILRTTRKSMQVEVSVRNISGEKMQMVQGQTDEKISFPTRDLHFDMAGAGPTTLSFDPPWRMKPLPAGDSLSATFQVPLEGKAPRTLRLRARLEFVEGRDLLKEELEFWEVPKR